MRRGLVRLHAAISADEGPELIYQLTYVLSKKA